MSNSSRSRDIDIAWAAGLFEGEGCISIAVKRGNRNVRSRPKPKLSVRMTDLDVLRRFVKIVGHGRVGGPYRNTKWKAKYKSIWAWSWQGNDAAQWFITNLGPHLGKRRLVRLKEVIELESSIPYASENTRRWALGIRGDTKICTKCDKEKNRNEFGSSGGRPYGHSWCKLCRAKAGRLGRKAAA